MSEINLLKEYCRMCKETECGIGCPIFEAKGDLCLCKEWILSHPDEATKIVTKWTKEHPQRTRQDVFLERYPKAMLENGVVNICPRMIVGRENIECGAMDSCVNCSKKILVCTGRGGRVMRLIDADELIKDRVENDPVRIAAECAPTVDVVRCRDCKYFEKAECIDGFLICPASGMEIHENDYCSYGERRSQDD